MDERTADRLAKFTSLRDILAFRPSGERDCFYQESLCPFFLMLMRVDAASPESTAISVYTPSEQVILPPDYLGHGRTEDSQHRHNSFEFTYVLEGSMYQLVEGKRYYYPAGSCCLMNWDTLHTEDVSTGFTCVFLSVTREYVAHLMGCGDSLLFPGEARFLDNLIFRFFRENLTVSGHSPGDFLDFVPKITQNEQVALVHQIFEELLRALILPSTGTTFRLAELFVHFTELLGNADYYVAEHVTARSGMDTLLFARIDRILSERHGRVSNRELAEMLNYNGSYLGRIVKRHTGRSLFEYSMTFTMDWAARELISTNKSVSEIASELSFTNLSHFYKLFHSRFGCTPGEYRAMRKA